MTEGKHTKSH